MMIDVPGQAAGARVDYQLSRPLPECGPIRVALEERLDDLGKPKSGPLCGIDDVVQRVRRPELAVGGVELGDTTFP